MSDLLEAAATALGTPAALIQRSAAARAAANGATTDEILTAWAGGAPASAPAPAPVAEAIAEMSVEPEVEPQPSPVAVLDAPPPAPVAAPMVDLGAVAFEEAPGEPLEPAPVAERVRTAVRVGAWTGAALGLVGFLVAGAFWAPPAAILPESGPPVAQIRPTTVMIGVALISILFGAVVASLSRAAASWRDPAMQLSGSRSGTTWIGAAIGLVLGVAAGALLAGMGTPIEGSEDGIIQLPVLTALLVLLAGGAVLGGATAAVPQIFGTPVAVTEEELSEVATVRKRLGDAVGIPVAGVLLLGLLVLPFAYALIRTNHLTSNGAAVVAVITAGGILGFAALAGSKPNVRISFGELMVAVIGIGTVLLIILAVLAVRSGDDEEAQPEGRAPAVSVL